MYVIWITAVRLSTRFKGNLFNSFNVITLILLMKVTRFEL